MRTYTIQFDGADQNETIEATGDESAWLSFTAWVESVRDEVEGVGEFTLHNPEGEIVARKMVY